jgi:ABC-type sugar transport system permease subunit
VSDFTDATAPHPVRTVVSANSNVNEASWRTRAGRSEKLLFLLFIGPNMILFSIFTFWPMLYNIYLSTVRWDMISPRRQSIGLSNFEYLLTQSSFHQVLINTALFTVGAVGGTLVLGLLFALLLNQPLRGRNGARAVVFAPTLLSGAAIAIVWIYMFDPRFGVIAQMLALAGITSPRWLNDPNWAMFAIIIVYVWKNLGITLVIYLAGLQAIPKELYEAAKIDGAGAIRTFWSVTIPMLSPITFFLFVTSLLSSFQAFDIIHVMTRGGPVDATMTLIYYVYEQGFVVFNAGRAAAAALVLFVIMFVITMLQLRYSERKVHYG